MTNNRPVLWWQSTPVVKDGKVLCVAVGRDGEETTSLFTLGEIVEQLTKRPPTQSAEPKGENQMKMYHKYVNKFVLGHGYVQQPPVVMTEEEVNSEIKAQGGQKYQNVFYVEIANDADGEDSAHAGNPHLLSGIIIVVIIVARKLWSYYNPCL